MGKIRGTPCMRSHICVHRATIKYFSNSFVFKTEIEKEGLPGDITPALGAGGPRFKSGRPDQNYPYFLQATNYILYANFNVEIRQAERASARSLVPEDQAPRLREIPPNSLPGTLLRKT